MAALAYAILAGCSPRDTPAAVATPTLDGLDIACTRHAFYQHWPDIRARDNALAFGAETCGLYEPATRTCYVVCADPAHPTATESLYLAHEHCHRVEHLYGADAADPLWAALPRRLLTHPAIVARLRAKGLLK